MVLLVSANATVNSDDSGNSGTSDLSSDLEVVLKQHGLPVNPDVIKMLTSQQQVGVVYYLMNIQII